jgi:hypothetical protein
MSPAQYPPGTPERVSYDAAAATRHASVAGVLLAMSRVRHQPDSVRLAHLDGLIDALPLGAVPAEQLAPAAVGRVADLLAPLGALASELEESGQRYAAARIRRVCSPPTILGDPTGGAR